MKLMPVKKILIVDDSATERHVLSELLRGRGFDVAMAENAEDGIVRARELMPDLILMDVVMPGMNGFQATRALTRDDQTRNIPIILCTTKDQETDKIWGLRQGAQDYVTKPVDHAALLGKIAAIQ
jgi:twitching motility two-component system response regulator PilH